MDHDHRDELDRIIDRGLMGYAAHEPLAGLEDRVLNRIRLESQVTRRAAWRWWVLLVPALAAAAILVVVSRTGRAPVARPVPTAHVETPPAPLVPVKPAAPGIAPERIVKRTRAARQSAASSTALPKREQFPTPTPISPEDRALVALAQFEPTEAAALADFQKHSSQEIEITPIEIPPLHIDGNR